MDEAGARARATYTAAADTFDEPALGFWDRFGAATVDRLAVPPGARILDVCCGAGASAVPAARAVGPSGHVVGVDLVEWLLALAQAEADRLGLTWLELRHGDVERLHEPAGSCDAVLVVFGLSFLPDVPAALRRLWQLVAPGGRLAVTTCGPGLLEPGSSASWDAVGQVRPDLHRAWNPWDSLTDPGALERLLRDAVGTCPVAVEAVPGVHALSDPGQFWTVVTGTGFRATHDALAPEERRAVHDLTLARLHREQVTALRTDVAHAVATRPAAGQDAHG